MLLNNYQNYLDRLLKTYRAVAEQIELESYGEIVVRALKIFLFIIALDLPGSGFKPIIDQYVVCLNSKYLYWINMSSAVLDSATLASAEISARMSSEQIIAVLMGLLVSGGMMIPGNIPNIISACKLRKSATFLPCGPDPAGKAYAEDQNTAFEMSPGFFAISDLPFG